MMLQQSKIVPDNGFRHDSYAIFISLTHVHNTFSWLAIVGCFVVSNRALKVQMVPKDLTAHISMGLRYMILSRNIGGWHSQENAVVRYDSHSLIFNNVGIMLHGKSKLFTDISTIIKHGGGQVFNTLQRLIQNLEVGRISIGVVVAEDENHASRHLKQCALENNVSMTSIYWIISCLYAGQLIPLKEKRKSKCLPAIKIHRLHDPMELSPEI